MREPLFALCDGAATAEAGSDDDFDFDLTKTGDAEFEVQDITRWVPGLKSAAIKVQYVSSRYDSVGVEGKKQAYTIIIEDKSGKTTLCSFGEEAKKLKAAVAGNEGAVYIFTNLSTRPIEEARFQLGRIGFEFQFQKASEAKLAEKVESEQPILKLQHFASAMGRVAADVNVRALTKFTNFNHSSSPNPLYRGWVTDGDFRMEAEMPFVPSFQLGDEFKIVKAMPHVSGDLVYLSIASAADIKAVTVEVVPKKLKGLRFVEVV
ncbi:hypothetical protein AAVH_19111 [Aphelenchoides avenae]|nr:hypothetical protein AAVH_19111 [Aphelenchus avenae]